MLWDLHAFLEVDKVPQCGEVVVHSTSQQSATAWWDRRTFYRSTKCHIVVRSSYILPVKKVPQCGPIQSLWRGLRTRDKTSERLKCSIPKGARRTMNSPSASDPLFHLDESACRSNPARLYARMIVPRESHEKGWEKTLGFSSRFIAHSRGKWEIKLYRTGYPFWLQRLPRFGVVKKTAASFWMPLPVTLRDSKTARR